MIVKDVFENIIYPDLKTYVENNSKYSPTITKKKPQTSKVFPVVPVRLLPFSNIETTLDYSEKRYSFGIEIDVYAMDIEETSKRTICDEITTLIINYLNKKYRFRIRTNLDAPNEDVNIHRNNIRITGYLDTKYGLDKLIIQPR